MASGTAGIIGRMTLLRRSEWLPAGAVGGAPLPSLYPKKYQWTT